MSVNGPEDCGVSCIDTFQLIVTSEIYPAEYYVTNFILESNLFEDYTNNGIKDLEFLCLIIFTLQKGLLK